MAESGVIRDKNAKEPLPISETLWFSLHYRKVNAHVRARNSFFPGHTSCPRITLSLMPRIMPLSLVPPWRLFIRGIKIAAEIVAQYGRTYLDVRDTERARIALFPSRGSTAFRFRWDLRDLSESRLRGYSCTHARWFSSSTYRYMKLMR